MTLDAFLAWEERQERPYEFDGFQPVAMTGGTAAHNLIIGNLWAALRDQLRGTRCTAYSQTMKIEAASSIRYPDVLVTCAPVAPDATLVQHPVVVFEVISKGTARTDRVRKLHHYHATPSIQSYVIVEQTEAVVTLFTREGDHWAAAGLGIDDTLALPEIGVELPVADLYLDVALAELDPE